MADLTKEERKDHVANTAAFQLHVGLIMRTEGRTKSFALTRAYVEGPAGLNRRLPPKELPK